MPSFLPHLVAPLLFALAFLPIERKRILLLAPLVWVPDLDFFFAKDYHRAILGNIWIPLGFLAALVVLWRRRDPGARFGEYMFRPGAPANLFLAAYYFLGHALMDVFAGGVPLFWPLSTYSPYLFLSIRVNTATGEPAVVRDGGAPADIPTITPVYEWFSTIDAAVLVFLLVATGLWLAFSWWCRRVHPPPVVVHREARLLPALERQRNEREKRGPSGQVR